MPFPQNVIAACTQLNFTIFFLSLAAIAMDVLTGFIIKGVIGRAISSSAMRSGLTHKAWELALMLAAALTDVAVVLVLSPDAPQYVFTATCAYILVMEVASVAENALEGYPELASAPVIKYVLQLFKQKQDEQTTIPAQNVEVSDGAEVTEDE